MGQKAMPGENHCTKTLHGARARCVQLPLVALIEVGSVMNAIFQSGNAIFQNLHYKIKTKTIFFPCCQSLSWRCNLIWQFKTVAISGGPHT